MDITITFTETVRRIKQTNKVVNEILDVKSKEDKKLLLRRQQSCFFNKDAKGLISSITDMKNTLVEYRKDYINIYSPLLSLASVMTDRERDQMDANVEKFVSVCNDIVKRLRDQANRSKLVSSQLNEHQIKVIDLVLNYLKSVIDIHSQQKAIRIKRALEKQRLIRLGNIINWEKSAKQTKEGSNNVGSKQHINSINKENVKPPVNEEFKELWDKSGKSDANKGNDREELDNKSNPKNLTIPATTSVDNNEETYQQLELSKHELQAFEKENKFMFNQLNSVSDEVRDIEMKVIEIARLQQIFTDNVLKQEIDMNKLSDSTISSTENIRSGNQQLREAMKKNAGFRVWVLFFITVLAFVILFLDWYNP